MNKIDGLELADLALSANREYLTEQGERVKRHIRNLNGEIDSLILQKDQTEAKLKQVSQRLADVIARKKKIMGGDWSAVPEGEAKKQPFDAVIDESKPRKDRYNAIPDDQQL